MQQLIETTTLIPDGAWFAPLAPIGEPALVTDTIAQALSVRETGGEIIAPLREFLRSKHLLLWGAPPPLKAAGKASAEESLCSSTIYTSTVAEILRSLTLAQNDITK